MENIVIYPSKSQFKFGERIDVIVELNGNIIDGSILNCSIYRFHEEVCKLKKVAKSCDKKIIFSFDIDCNGKAISGYGVEVTLENKDGNNETFYTAFDVTDSWKSAPRYGFISDFFDEDIEDEEDIKEMNRYHINVVQFYDWMYRHHEFIPPEEKFVDPLGRNLNISVVKQKIGYSHKYGMRAMAYGAVYGAGTDFFKKNKELGIYKNDGEVYGFGDFLCMMDINRKSKWHDHIINEFLQSVKFGFDGIHMDQYGFPKEAISMSEGKSNIRYLQNDFPDLINDTKDYINKEGYDVDLIFNAVNNWPVEKAAKAKEDAVYIEVWSPNDTYQDLYRLINDVKKYEPNKQVILAAYMRPFLEELNIPLEAAKNSAMLTMATTFASGGFHLLLGEKNGILDDPYYPKYRSIRDEEFNTRVRRYYDFIVKYGELLFDFDIFDTTMVSTGGINEDYVFNGAKFSPQAKEDHVWTLIKEKPGYKIINLINFTNIDDMRWNEKKDNEPLEIKNIEITAAVTAEIKEIYVVSPDFNDGKPLKLNFEFIKKYSGRAVTFSVPNLKIWDMIYITY